MQAGLRLAGALGVTLERVAEGVEDTATDEALAAEGEARRRRKPRAQAVLTFVRRTCWLQGRSALDFLSQLLRGTPVALASPP